MTIKYLLVSLIIISLVGCKSAKVYNKKVDQFGLTHIEPEGITRSYYQNGQLAFEGEYKSGKPIGTHVYFYKNGQISRKAKPIKKGGWVLENFSKNGQHLLTETIYSETKYKINFKDNYLHSIELNEKIAPVGDLFSGEIRIYNKEGFLLKKIMAKDGKSKVIYERKVD